MSYSEYYILSVEQLDLLLMWDPLKVSFAQLRYWGKYQTFIDFYSFTDGVCHQFLPKAYPDVVDSSLLLFGGHS